MNLMNEKSIGKVLQVTGSANISFVSTQYYAGKFVKLPMDHIAQGITLLGEVTSIDAVNPYFEKAATVRYVEEADESVTSQTVFVSHFRPLAYLKGGTPYDSSFPPSPGSRVFLADDREIQIALGLEDDGVSVGSLLGKENLSVKLSINKLLRTHFSVLGRTGAGKSFFTKGLLNGITNQIKFILLSPTGEYNDVSDNLDGTLYKGSEITFPLELGYLSMIYGLTMREQIIFEKFYKGLGEKDITLTSHQILTRFRDWFMKQRSPSESTSLFPDESDSSHRRELPPYGDTILSKIRQRDVTFAKPALKIPFEKSAILDMSDQSQETQELLITHVLSNLLQSYKKSPGKRTLIVIEEAHNFAPSIQTTACKDKIVQVAREGRKLGINLCLISQRPRHIDQTVLSQAGTLFLFNMQHPDDVQHVLGISPTYNPDMPDTLRTLDVGQCFIIGEATRRPIVCRVSFS